VRNVLQSTILDELQQLLKADGMFTLVTDRLGIYKENSQKSILDFLLQEERLWVLPIEQCLQKIDQLSRPITLELELPGLFVSVAPIKTNQNVFYLWVMEGVAVKVKEQLLDLVATHYELPNEWHDVLQSMPATDAANREKTLVKLELLVQLAAQVFDSRFAGAYSLQQDAAILNAAERLKKGNMEVYPFLNELILSPPDSFFCGYAEAIENDKYCITEMLNAKQKQMIGTTYQLGEGFLGQASMIGEFINWQYIETDSRSQLFIQNDLVPHNLYCVPIKKSDEIVSGLIFLGCTHPNHDLSEIITSIRIFAELYGFQHALDVLEKAFQRQKTYLSSLIEIAKLVTIIQEKKSLLTVLVDISINLVDDARSGLFMFLFPGNSKVNIVSRGITQEQAQLYCKELINRYFGISVQINKPSIADTPWGETALECPISYRSEVRGVICVFLPKTKHMDEYVDLFHAFMTLSNIAIERTIKKYAENESNREVTLLFESMGQWNKQEQELHSRAQFLATGFADSLSLNKDDISLISSACLISSYPSDFLRKYLPDERELIGLILEYHTCMQAAEKNEEEEFSTACQIMTLVYTYLYEGESQDFFLNMKHIPLKIREQFFQFIKQQQSLDFEIEIEHANENKTLNFDALMQEYNLTSREKEVYELVVSGSSNRDIAERLFISEHTVKNHNTNLFQKLNVGDRAQAIALAYKSKFY
jgi:DNA-binding CsgD family transcriptional regulator